MRISFHRSRLSFPSEVGGTLIESIYQSRAQVLFYERIPATQPNYIPLLHVSLPSYGEMVELRRTKISQQLVAQSGGKSAPVLMVVMVQLLSRVSVSCNPRDCSLPGSSVHGVSQARILEWVAISFSRDLADPGNQIQVSCISGRFFFFF